MACRFTRTKRPPAASTHPAWATRHAAQSSDETGAVLVTSPKLAPRAAEPRPHA